MPGLAQKLLICAAVDGLLIQPAGTRTSDGTTVRIEYGTNRILPPSASTPHAEDESKSAVLEAHGIIGLLNLVSSSYLISITRRDQVAQIRNHPIYAIRDVTLVPLASQTEAERAIVSAQKLLKQGNIKAESPAEQAEESDDAGLSDAESIDAGGADQKPKPEPENEAAVLEPPKGALKKSATVVKSTVATQGGNVGRYAQRWFRRGPTKPAGNEKEAEEAGLTMEQERQTAEALPQEAADDEKLDSGEDAQRDTKDKTAPPKQKSVIESLTPRILRGARLYFSSSGFFFSYEHDLSSTMAKSGNLAPETPLWKRFDPLFFWNRHLITPFTDHHALALPVMQGFVGQRAFSIARPAEAEKDVVAEAALDAEAVIKAQDESSESKTQSGPETSDFLLTIISRRSVKRAGLRYLRRGVDEDGYVANNVETEQILSSQSWSDSDKAFSLVQIRGSIPLFFSQSPYSFKPLPVMFGSETTNQTALKKHFDLITKRYGGVYAASLVDKHGTEARIGDAYERSVETLNSAGGADGQPVGFEWFDFHSACKGMKFENVSILMETLNSSLTAFGWLVKQGDENTRSQTGVLRTNCMDCLDRTNVVQSAVAGWALQQQLGELGLDIDLRTDPKTQWFNSLWADNGDAISRQYAGTSALKGDFTRTRKRNWKGALSDFSLTLNRYYNNIFGDYFLQTCIDYYLGNSGPAVFDEFEADMMSQDYALDMRHVRQSAIETCLKIVLEDPKESLRAGWTLSCPHEAGTLRSLPFEECVVLLTDQALYFCRFDWETEKVGSFERVDLADIVELWRGAYITSALAAPHLDESRNVGFALRYKTGGTVVVRKNTRALGNEEEEEDGLTSDAAAVSDKKEGEDVATTGGSKKEEVGKTSGTKAKPDDQGETRLLAFKALPPKAAASKDSTLDLAASNEVDGIKHICEEIHEACRAAILKTHGYQHLSLERPPDVQEKDLISVADAKKSTGYVESLGYSLKRLVWS